MAAPRVFISYSHESEIHSTRVLALANRLRSAGIDANIDQYVRGEPKSGWPMWMERQVRESDYVIIVWTKEYYDRVVGLRDGRNGRGVYHEGILIRNALFAGANINKFVSVQFDQFDDSCVLQMCQGSSVFVLNEEYEDLHRRLFDLSVAAKPALGVSLPKSGDSTIPSPISKPGIPVGSRDDNAILPTQIATNRRDGSKDRLRRAVTPMLFTALLTVFFMPGSQYLESSKFEEDAYSGERSVAIKPAGVFDRLDLKPVWLNLAKL